MTGIILLSMAVFCGVLTIGQMSLLNAKHKLKAKNEKNNDQMINQDKLYISSYKENMKMRYLKHDIRELIRNNPEYQNCETNEDLLNTVFKLKKEFANKYAVEFSVDECSGYDISGFEREDLVRLFSNILNNAIEAASLSEEKYVKVHIKNENGKSAFVFINSIKRGSSPIGNGFKTSKENKDDHGFGTKIIKEIAGKYNKKIVVDENEKEFILKLEL
ncbi:GHKL domain-containing protein [Lachnospiraceae bacterium RM5]|nr:GHKL domain-containing protein [Lachnospiraceae bacterium RM5]